MPNSDVGRGLGRELGHEFGQECPVNSGLDLISFKFRKSTELVIKSIFIARVYFRLFFIKHNLFLFKTGLERASGLFQIIDLVLQLQTVFELVQKRFVENYTVLLRTRSPKALQKL